MESQEECIENSTRESPLQNQEKKRLNQEITLEELYRRVSLGVPVPNGFNRDGVIFIGRTKEGKTTLFNYLKETPLRAITDENDLEGRQAIVSDDPNDDNGIGMGYGSRTVRPNNYRDWYDPPGVAGDTRGPMQDIINSWIIRSLCMDLEKIKIVIVISTENLNLYLEMTEIFRAVWEIFPEISQRLSSLCLVITKGQNTRVERVRRSFENLLSEHNKIWKEQTVLDVEQHRVFKILFKHFSKEESFISFFRRPKDEGLISSDGRQAIINTIESATWYENPLVGPGISAESRDFLNQLKEKEIDDFSKFLGENTPQILYKYVKRTLYEGSGSSKDFEGILLDLEMKLASLSEREGPLEVQNALNIFEEIQKDLEKKSKNLEGIEQGLEVLKDFIFKKRKYLNFLTHFDPSIMLRNVADRLSFLSLIREALSSLRDKPSIGIVDKLITLQGRIISSSDINEAYFNNPAVCEIEIHASVVVFLDDNICAPGVTLRIRSPLVQVFGSPTICLSGKKGEKHERAKAENGASSQGDTKSENDERPSVAACGNSGLPGLPGQNGGSFLIKTDCFKNSQNLRVQTNGGEGGPGQHGGDGANGMNGSRKLALKLVQKRDPKAHSGRKLYVCETFGDVAKQTFKDVFTFNSQFTSTYEIIEKGQEGGAGGKGGEGGVGGNPGVIDVGGELLKGTIQEHGGFGPNGEPGKPGLGGEDSPTCVGVYVEEEILSSLRRQRDVGADSAGNMVASTAVLAATTTVSNNVYQMIASKAASYLFGAFVTSSKLVVAVTSIPLATGVAAGLVLKTATSFISKNLTNGWLIEPHEVDTEPCKANDGEIPLELNGENRKDSDPIQEIDCDGKNEKYIELLKKEKNLFAKELIPIRYSV